MNTDFMRKPMRQGEESCLKRWIYGALILLTFMLFGAVLALAAHFFGSGWTVAILICASGLLSIIIWKQKRKFQVLLENLTVKEAEDYKHLCSELGIEEPFCDLEEAELNWVGKTFDVFLGGLSFVGPITISQLARGERITLDTAFSGRDMFFAFVGCGLYLLIRKKLLNRFIITRKVSSWN